MITSSHDRASGILIHTVIGTVTAEELLDFLLEPPSGPPTRRILWDASDAHFTDLSSQDLRSILWRVQEMTRIRREVRVALLFSRPSGFGVGRMLEAMADSTGLPIQIHSFLDRGAAREWLLAGRRRGGEQDEGTSVA